MKSDQGPEGGSQSCKHLGQERTLGQRHQGGRMPEGSSKEASVVKPSEKGAGKKNKRSDALLRQHPVGPLVHGEGFGFCERN